MIPAALALAIPKLGAWLVFSDDGSSLRDFQRHVDKIEIVSAEWYRCGTHGEVATKSGPNAAQRAVLVAAARRGNVRVFGLAGNGEDEKGGVAGLEFMLGDDLRMRRHAESLTEACVKDNLAGIDLDYENLEAKDRDAFSAFVDILAQKLHARKKRLLIALHAKTAEPGNWGGPQAQDWKRIGRAVDRARVMTYDEHWSTSTAGPVASPAWAESVMQFAVTQIALGKLDMGLPGYGYDWKGSVGQGIGWDEFQKLQGIAKPVRDLATQELVLVHGDRTAWFADSVAADPKLQTAAKLHLRGLTLWRLGSEDPALWTRF